MITSKKGKEMLLEVSPIYFKDKTMQAIFEAIGREMDLTEEIVEDVKDQLFVQTATWGLDYWEDAVGLPVKNRYLDIETRRKAILAKMQTRYPVTVQRVKRIIETATGQKVEIIQNVAPYTFEIRFIDAEDLDLRFIDILNEIKPAHLSYRIKSLDINKLMIKGSISSGTTRIPLTGRLITSEELFIEEDYIRYRIIRHRAAAKSIDKEREVKYPLTNTFRTGTWPYSVKGAYTNRREAAAISKDKHGKVYYPVTGIYRTGGKIYENFD